MQRIDDIPASRTGGRTSRTALATAAMLCVTALAITGMLTHAGPLDPPAGPVAASYKTLTEVEPRIAISSANTPGDVSTVFKITQSGSYYLTSNMTGVATKAGILIAADNVTLDLSGFTMQGVAGSAVGVGTIGNRSNITVCNGTVRNWGSGGVILPFVSSSSTRGFTIHHIAAIANGAQGIVTAEAGIIEDCTASANGGDGIAVSNHAIMHNCIATSNGGNGFTMGFGSSATGCLARANSFTGFIIGGGDCSVVACSATLNGQNGFNIARGTAQNCASSFNGANAYIVSTGLLEHCTAFTSATDGVGVLVSGGSTVRDVQVNSSGAGIRVTGVDNRIENNNVIASTTAFDILNSGNVIVRNSATNATTRYNIVAGNAAGPIINSAAVATSTIPTANYDY